MMTKVQLETKLQDLEAANKQLQAQSESFLIERNRVINQANMISATLAEIDIIAQNAPIKRRFNILNIFTYVKELVQFVETIVRLIQELKEKLKAQQEQVGSATN